MHGGEAGRTEGRHEMQHQITAPLREYVAAIREYDATAPFCRAYTVW